MPDATNGTIEVELTFVLPHAQVAQTLRVHAGTTVGQAIDHAGILSRYPELAGRPLATGIFGRRVAASQVLREFDRIEIYQPLRVDPKQARLARQALKSTKR